MFFINVDKLKSTGIGGDLAYVIPVLEQYTHELASKKLDDVSTPYKKNSKCFIDIRISTKDPQSSRHLAELIAKSYGDPRVLFA